MKMLKKISLYAIVGIFIVGLIGSMLDGGKSKSNKEIKSEKSSIKQKVSKESRVADANKDTKEKEIAKSFGFDSYLEYQNALNLYSKKGNLDFKNDKLYMIKHLTVAFLKHIDLSVHQGAYLKKQVDFMQYKNGKIVMIANYSKNKIKAINIVWESPSKSKISKKEFFEFSNKVYNLFNNSLSDKDKNSLQEIKYDGWDWTVYELEKRIGDYLIKIKNEGGGKEIELTIALEPLLNQENYEKEIKKFDKEYQSQNIMNKDDFIKKHSKILVYNYGQYFEDWVGQIYYDYRKNSVADYNTVIENLAVEIHHDNIDYIVAMRPKDKIKMINFIKENNIKNGYVVKFSGSLYDQGTDSVKFSDSSRNIAKPYLSIKIKKITRI